MLYGLAVFIFVLVCIMLMGIILLQSSKTGGMGTAMGGQAINTAFGGYGADKILVKITSGLAVSFIGFKITKSILYRYYKNQIDRRLFFTSNNYIFLSLVVFLFLVFFLAIGSAFDIFISNLFYYGNKEFVLQSYYIITIFFRKIILPLILVYVLIIPIFSFFLPLKKLYFGFQFGFKDVLYMWLSNFIGILIIINLLLKNLWGRARPGDVIELGGDSFFTPWYLLGDGCLTNCSFVSGDAAVGFSIIALYFVSKNNFYIFLSILMGSGLGLIRIMEGGHFLSDVIASGIIIIVCCFVFSKFYLKKINV